MKPLAATGLALALAVSLVGCGGDGRSAEAFCSTMAKYKERYLDQMDNASDNLKSGGTEAGVIGLVQAFGAISDLTRMWEDLAKVAPDEVSGDVEAVRDAWKKQQEESLDDPTDPLKGLGKSILTGMQNMGPLTRVDEFTRKNCS